MVRLLIFLAALALVAAGLTWLANNPGVVDLTWRGEQYEVSLLFGLGAVLALAIAIALVCGLLRFVFRFSSLCLLGARARTPRGGGGRAPPPPQPAAGGEPADGAGADDQAPASPVCAARRG